MNSFTVGSAIMLPVILNEGPAIYLGGLPDSVLMDHVKQKVPSPLLPLASTAIKNLIKQV